MNKELRGAFKTRDEIKNAITDALADFPIEEDPTLIDPLIDKVAQGLTDEQKQLLCRDGLARRIARIGDSA